MKIVALDGATLNPGDNPWEDVARLGSFVCYERTAPGQLLERASDAEVLLVNKVAISAESISRLPKLRFISVTATGYNMVDVKAARARGITVSNVPIYGTDTVAEYVFALILNFYRQPQLHSELVKAGEWTRSAEWTFWRSPLAELAGKTIGIVGFGRIGRRVGELAAAFKMKVLANDTFKGNPPSYGFGWCEVPELFAQSDVVSLHCNLTPENTRMVNAALLGRMKKSAYLINAARGPLVDEAALVSALKGGAIGGAALDVVSAEPIAADSPLLSAPNLTLTPHIAWATLEARRRLMRQTAENVAGFLAGNPINIVN